MADEATGTAAGGNLAETPLPELLARLDAERFTGDLELSVNNRTHRVALAEGRVLRVQLAVPVEPLGRLLIDRGLIEAEGLDRVLKRQPATGRLLGELLVEEGRIAADALEQALGDQVRRRLLRLFLAGDGSYRLVPGADGHGGRGGPAGPVDALAVLPEGVRNSVAADELEMRLQKRMAGRTASVRRGADWSRIGFSPAEQSACRYLARGSWDAGVFRSVPPEHRSTLLVAATCLFAVGQIVMEAPSFMPSPDAAEAAAADEALRREIADLHANLKDRNYFERLGVSETVAPQELNDKYLELVKRYHPDRAVRHGLTDLTDQLEEILMSIREAFETLNDPELREAYAAKLGGRGKPVPSDMRELVDRAISAEHSYQLAVVLERQHKLEEAQKAADEALRVAPGQGEYDCMALWLKAARRQPRASVEDLVQPMMEAAAAATKHERAQMQAGRLLQRAGRTNEAVEFFRRVLQLNPQNVDAAREIRLAGMRTSRAPPPSHGGGLLDRLLRRKAGPKSERRRVAAEPHGDRARRRGPATRPRNRS
ncbi:MAG: DnaJ domain-containing protein [Deltaproteobacteria bacterium]|nr:DnaJ domain-containing protein [Deltaproteobacteria bacterium]